VVDYNIAAPQIRISMSCRPNMPKVIIYVSTVMAIVALGCR